MFYNRKTNKIWPNHILVCGRHLGSRSGTFSSTNNGGKHVAHNQARIATPWRAQNTNYQYAFAVHARGHAHEEVSRMHEPKTCKIALGKKCLFGLRAKVEKALF